MPNPTSTRQLLEEKRFYSLVNREMAEHKQVIASHDRRMHELIEVVSTASERFDSHLERVNADMKEATLSLKERLVSLQEKMLALDVRITEQKDNLDAFYKLLKSLCEDAAPKHALEKVKQDFESSMTLVTSQHLSSLQDMQAEVKKSLNQVKDECENFKASTEAKMSSLSSDIESGVRETKMDKDAVLKEVRAYDKAMFIIEKKIENLYTLIERLSK